MPKSEGKGFYEKTHSAKKPGKKTYGIKKTGPQKTSRD